MTDIDPKERPATPLTDKQDDQALPIDPEQHETEDEVDEASDESFPASDPPSFTRSTTAE